MLTSPVMGNEFIQIQIHIEKWRLGGLKCFHTVITDVIEDIVVIFSSWTLLAAEELVRYVIDCEKAKHD